MNEDNKYVNSPDHIRTLYHEWWDKRKEFSYETIDFLYGESEFTKEEIVQKGYQLIGEGYMIAQAAKRRWSTESEEGVPEEYEYMTYSHIMNSVKIIDQDLYGILDLDPVTEEYKEACDRLLRAIFGEENEAEKVHRKLSGKVNYKP